MRRPKPRDRIRYDDEDEDEYDDRYYRKPLRSREQSRVRERDRDRERERERYRPKEEEDRRSKPKVVEYEKPSRHRDYSLEEDDRIKDLEEERPVRTKDKNEGSRGKGYKDSGKRIEDEEEDEEEERYIPRKHIENSASSARGSVEPTPKTAREGSRKPPVAFSEEKIESDSSFAADDEEISEEKVKPPPEKTPSVENTGEGGRPRKNYFPRTRTTTVKPVSKPGKLIPIPIF